VPNNAGSTGGVTGRGFLPGRSGNLKGRPPSIAAHLQKKYGRDGQKLIAELHTLAFKSKTDKVRVQALGMLLDRGWGRAKETVSIETPGTLRLEHSGTDELMARLQKLTDALSRRR